MSDPSERHLVVSANNTKIAPKNRVQFVKKMTDLDVLKTFSASPTMPHLLREAAKQRLEELGKSDESS